MGARSPIQRQAHGLSPRLRPPSVISVPSPPPPALLDYGTYGSPGVYGTGEASATVSAAAVPEIGDFLVLTFVSARPESRVLSALGGSLGGLAWSGYDYDDGWFALSVRAAPVTSVPAGADLLVTPASSCRMALILSRFSGVKQAAAEDAHDQQLELDPAPGSIVTTAPGLIVSCMGQRNTGNVMNPTNGFTKIGFAKAGTDGNGNNNASGQIAYRTTAAGGSYAGPKWTAGVGQMTGVFLVGYKAG